MAHLSILTDTSASLHLKQNHWVGWIFVLVGAGLCALPRINSRVDDPWVIYVVGGLFAAAGLLAAFYRVDVRLDLLQRRYRIVKGFWPNPRVYTGGFDEIEGLWFEKQWRTSGGKRKTKYLVWQTGLKVRAIGQAVGLYESTDEADARQWFERRARQLRVKTKDFTSGTGDERDWERLDDPATVRAAEPGRGFTTVDLSRPPAGLTFHQDRDGVRYTAAAPGWTATAVIGVLAGLPFLVFGAFALIIGFGLHEYLGWEIRVSGSTTIAVALGAIFALVGAGIIKLAIDHARAEQRFALHANEFVYSIHVGSRAAREDRLKYLEIEAFGVRESTARRGRQTASINGVGIQRWSTPRRPELFIRTDRKVVTIRDLDGEAAAFLVNAFHTHAARRSTFRSIDAAGVR